MRQYLNIHLIIFILVCCPAICKKQEENESFHSLYKQSNFNIHKHCHNVADAKHLDGSWFGITRSWGSARPLPPPPRFVAAARKVVEEEEPGEPEVWWNKTCKKSDIYHMNWWRISSIKSMFAIYYSFLDSLVISHLISSSSSRRYCPKWRDIQSKCAYTRDIFS